mmetsp:Transcript_16929/g.24317  ORF Transcript_16929/g.24317 Transcript_16929/m.24317 type:complete len:133 (-) Transcript_16929:10-408(-)
MFPQPTTSVLRPSQPSSATASLNHFIGGLERQNHWGSVTTIAPEFSSFKLQERLVFLIKYSFVFTVSSSDNLVSISSRKCQADDVRFHNANEQPIPEVDGSAMQSVKLFLFGYKCDIEILHILGSFYMLPNP